MPKKSESLKACPKCGTKDVRLHIIASIRKLSQVDMIEAQCPNLRCDQLYWFIPRALKHKFIPCTGRITVKSKIPPKAGK